MITSDADIDRQLPQDLKACVAFHGHLCPGLVYGYLVAKEAIRLLGLDHSRDEEVVAITENDSCAVDALQFLLGTTAGKGNLVFKDYGKNAFTVLSRSGKQAFRFSRRNQYEYGGAHQEEFEKLEAAVAAGRATPKEQIRQRQLKCLDLISKPFDRVFQTEAVKMSEPPYAPLAPSEACAKCGEMTMATKLIDSGDGRRLCMPCAEAETHLRKTR